MPKIVVLGSQSAGKSSVNESIVGIDFLPRGEGMVTKCPLVLSLINKEDLEQPFAEFDHLPNETFTDFKIVQKKIIERMNEISGGENVVKDEPIYMKIYGKEMPNLTLIDLPGLTSLNTTGMSNTTSDVIKKLAIKYIEDPNTIILVVSVGGDNIENSTALVLANEYDKERVRTIGVVTKVDLMNEGVYATEYLTNEKHPLKHGYIAVKLRAPVDIKNNVTIEDAIISEKNYFDEHEAYRNLEEEQGVPALRRKLSKIFIDHIARHLPRIEEEIIENIKYYTAKRRLLSPNIPIETRENQEQAIHNFILSFRTKFEKMVLFSGKECKSNYGGTMILAKFKQFMNKDLPETDPVLAFSNSEMLEEINFVNGINSGLFIPEEV